MKLWCMQIETSVTVGALLKLVTCCLKPATSASVFDGSTTDYSRDAI
jgi:hypothetical protein